MTSEHLATALRFEHFEVRPQERRLLVRGEPVALGARAFDLLVLLAGSAGRLLRKEELLEQVWPGVVVEENNLAVQISQLRKVLGGEAIATIPGHGYRFTARPDPAATAPDRAARPESSDELASAIAPPLAARPPPRQLAGPLFGRDCELAELGALVQDHALVTLVGAGGMGKSRLAQALVAMPQPARAHGACWVSLGELGQAALLPATLASALGVGLDAGEPLAALAQAMAPLQVLLALDGVEHLLEGVAALVPRLLEAAPGLHLLVTSQAPLGLPGEQVMRLGPLAVPGRPLPPAQALEHGAVALFMARATAAGARFALDEAHVAAMVELCRALDGLPLAIELAAARVPALGVQPLARAMADRLSLLTLSRNRAAPARQQTLRAALEWSHGLLDEHERIVFRRLAVVTGSASLANVLALGAEPEAGLDATAVLDSLAGLVDRSLVVVLEGDDAPRYRLLDSPRLLALERLRQAGEEPALRRRHAQSMATAFEAAYDDYYSGRRGWADWSRHIEPDLDNAREAMAWALGAQDHVLALQIGPTLLRAMPSARVEERRALAEAMLELAQGGGPERLRLRAWFQLATLWAESNRARSHAASEAVLRLARRLHEQAAGDPFVLYNALCGWARAATRIGDLAGAEAALQEARAIEHPDWPAQRLYWGVEAAFFLAQARGEAAAALHWLRRVLVLQQAAGSDDAVMLANLIDAELAHGDTEAAVRNGRALVDRLEGSRNERDLAFARVNLAAALLAQDDAEAAREVARLGWPQGRRFGLQPYWADYLSLLAALEGRPRCAARLAAFADARYLARGEERQGNEARAAARARTLVRAVQSGDGTPPLEQLRGQGESLREEEVAAQAFSRRDD